MSIKEMKLKHKALATELGDLAKRHVTVAKTLSQLESEINGMIGATAPVKRKPRAKKAAVAAPAKPAKVARADKPAKAAAKAAVKKKAAAPVTRGVAKRAAAPERAPVAGVDSGFDALA